MAEKQVTKAELARRLQVKPQSVDYMLTRKSIDTDTLYNVSKALDYDFALLYSISKEQINCDKKDEAYKVPTAKVLIVGIKAGGNHKIKLEEKNSGATEMIFFFSKNIKVSGLFVRMLHVISPNYHKMPAWTGIVHLLPHLIILVH